MFGWWGIEVRVLVVIYNLGEGEGGGLMEKCLERFLRWLYGREIDMLVGGGGAEAVECG